MQALGLPYERADSIFKHLHGSAEGVTSSNASDNSLKDWLIENGEVTLLAELQVCSLALIAVCA